MPSNERYYLVTGKVDTYLVQASTPSVALRTVAERLYRCDVARAQDIVNHMRNGWPVLEATKKPEQSDIEDIIDEQRQQQ